MQNNKKRLSISFLCFDIFCSFTLWAQMPDNYKGTPFRDSIYVAGPQVIPGRVEMAYFDMGGHNVGYYDTTPANEGAALNRTSGHLRPGISEYIAYFRENEGVDISYTKDWADFNHPNLVDPRVNQLYIGWQEDGEWTNYTVRVMHPGRYRIIGMYGYKDNNTELWLNDKKAATLNFPVNTGDWHRWNKATVGEISFPKAGLNLLTLKYNKGANLAYLDFVLEEPYSVDQATHIQLHTPSDNLTFSNNMPVLAWEKGDVEFYEIWIDGRCMDRVSGEKSSYIPFPLSFGKHEWKIVGVKGNERTYSSLQRFNIADRPLSELPEQSVLLRDDWMVKSALQVVEEGSVVSTSGFKISDWAVTSIPATALTALVRNGLYPNPYMDLNNMRIPDINDQFNQQYDLLKYSHISGKNPWHAAYWFRKEFDYPRQLVGEKIWLTLGELNYKASVWLNGKLLADTAAVKGMERVYRFDVTNHLSHQEKNVLAIAVYPPDNYGLPAPAPITPLADPGCNMADGVISHDYTKWDVMGWDWQPAIRDRDMGLTEDVFLSACGPVEIQHLHIGNSLNLPDTTNAALFIKADLVNHTDRVQQGDLQIRILGDKKPVEITMPYSLSPRETRIIELNPDNLKKLRIKNPRLWWPAGYGAPELYTLSLKAIPRQGEPFEVKEEFGIRDVKTYIGNNERVYRINGREIYPRGGNWVIDMMLNWNASRYEKEILLTRNANLNMLRVWGPTGIAPKPLFKAADRYGILLWQDFLNDFWGTFKNTPGYQPEENLYKEITTDIVRRYRNHPSLIIWCGGNEGVNPREAMIVNEILASEDNLLTRHYLKQSDGDGLHGGGPYHTLSPEEYFTHPKLHGFSSEIGPSGVPEYQSICNFMSAPGSSWLAGRFPLDGVWAYHDANDWPGDDTRKFSSYDNLLRNFYGLPDTTRVDTGLADYISKCQWVNYEAYRASIESINHQLWDKSSGILLWKSNSSWPSIAWQVYDWYLQAHAGYYGVRKAGSPVHIQLNRHDNTISAMNLTNRAKEAAICCATLYSKELETLWTEKQSLNLPSNQVVKSNLALPRKEGLQLLRLELYDKEGNSIADNTYWLSDKNDFTSLAALPAPQLEIRKNPTQGNDSGKWSFSIENKATSVANMVKLRLVGESSGHELLPSLWSDNYFILLPGEKKTIEVEINTEDLLENPVLEYSTYTSDKKRIKIL